MAALATPPALPSRGAGAESPPCFNTWNPSSTAVPGSHEHARLASGNFQGHTLQTSLGALPGGRRASHRAFPRETPPEAPALTEADRREASLSARSLTSALAGCRSVQELLELVASRRDGDGQLGPVHVSTAFHRVARHGSRLPRSQQDALRRHPTVQWLHAEACRRVQEMGAQSLGNIAWAHAEFRHGSVELMQGVAEAAGPLVHTFQPLEVSCMMQAFSQCPEVRQGRPLMELLVRKRVRGHVSAYSPNNIKDILWSCAKAGMLDTDLIDELCDAVESRIASFGCGHLAVICWSLAKLGVPRLWLMRAVASQVALRRDQLGPKDTANLAWAYAKLGVQSRELMAALAAQGAHDAHRFPAQSVSNTLWAFATLGHYNTKLLEAMCARLIALLEPFSAPAPSLSQPKAAARGPSAFPSQAFANSAWSLAVLGHYCPVFFHRLAVVCPWHLRDFTGQSLACLAFAFALVAHGSDPLFQALELEVERRLVLGTPSLGGRRSMVMLAWALALSRSRALASGPTAGKAQAVPRVQPRRPPSGQQRQGQGLALLRQHLLELCGEFSGEELCQLYQVELVARHLDASLDPALFPTQHAVQPLAPHATPPMHQNAAPGPEAQRGEGESPGAPSELQGTRTGAEGQPAQPPRASREAGRGEGRVQEGAPADEAAPESHVYLRRLWLAGTLQQQAKASWAAAHEEDKRKQSALQAGAAQALESLGLAAEEEHWEGDYSVDLAVCTPLACLLQKLQSPENGGEEDTAGEGMDGRGGHTGGAPQPVVMVKIAVEVDGPSHFARSLCGCSRGAPGRGGAVAHRGPSATGAGAQDPAEGGDGNEAACQDGWSALGIALDSRDGVHRLTSVGGSVSGSGEGVAGLGPGGEELWALGPTRFKARLLKAMGWIVVQVPFSAWDRLSLAEEKKEFLRQQILDEVAKAMVAVVGGTIQVHPQGTPMTAPTPAPAPATLGQKGEALPSEDDEAPDGGDSPEESNVARSQERAAAARRLILKGARGARASAAEEGLSRRRLLLQEKLAQRTSQALRDSLDSTE